MKSKKEIIKEEKEREAEKVDEEIIKIKNINKFYAR